MKIWEIKKKHDREDTQTNRKEKVCFRKMLQDRKTRKLVDNLTIDEQHRPSYCSGNNESNLISITTSDNADR